jgi:hypothetical protein
MYKKVQRIKYWQCRGEGMGEMMEHGWMI